MAQSQPVAQPQWQAQPQQQVPFPYAQPQQQMPQQVVPAGQNPYAFQGFQPEPMDDLNDPLMGEMAALRDRVTRVERALIRLDRRMQLLERNELGRMTGEEPQLNHNQGQMAPGPMSMAPASPLQNSFQSGEIGRGAPMAAPVQQNLGQPSLAMSRFGNVQPVAFGNAQSVSQPNVITSTLQAAPATPAARQPQQASGQMQGLPSLADAEEAAAQRGDIAIWTVRYDGGKVWPERQELAASREVVEALRTGQPVAIFARGQRPSSREFRDRVQALSRYLSKVANMEQVPIATLPAGHLDSDTIEIVTTR